ncbi:hypothetical protein C4577_05540 [Candidatus Parcubacteria bacterium]|nr:MAG: hypothetical protein C4577_05540 [Candidatus Parcubacteria bacterium]
MEDVTNLKEQITPEEKLKAKHVFKQVLPDITKDRSLPSSKFIKKYWNQYQKKFTSNQNINGKVFENLIATTLIREKIMPFYMQAKVAFIPYVSYDFIIYTCDIGPISLSIKTSLRERWKQADLEAVALKYIHRKSKSFVVTLDTNAVRRRRVDPSQALGIDDYVLADMEEFDEMLKSIKSHQLGLSPKVEVVSSSIIITPKNYIEFFG